MPIIWDKERISKLSIQELKNLKTNATDSGRSEIVELIDEELKSRPSPRVKSSKVRAHDIPRSSAFSFQANPHVDRPSSLRLQRHRLF
jgi:hypothetical protein